MIFECMVDRSRGNTVNGQRCQKDESSIVITSVYTHLLPLRLLYTKGFYGWFTIDPDVFESSSLMNDHAAQMWHEQLQFDEYRAAADALEAATALEEDDYEGARSQTEGATQSGAAEMNQEVEEANFDNDAQTSESDEEVTFV